MSVSKDMSVESAHDYMFLVHQLLPSLLTFMKTTSDRHGIIRALELTSKICAVRENYDYLVNTPLEFLETMVDLLCVGVSSIEPLFGDREIEKPPPCIGAYHELIDADVRNGAIETLASLCFAVAPLRVRIAAIPQSMRILQRILCCSDKREVSPKLTGLMISLAQPAENHSKFLAMQESVLHSASYDDNVAGTCFTVMFDFFPNPFAFEELTVLDICMYFLADFFGATFNSIYSRSDFVESTTSEAPFAGDAMMF